MAVLLSNSPRIDEQYQGSVSTFLVPPHPSPPTFPGPSPQPREDLWRGWSPPGKVQRRSEEGRPRMLRTSLWFRRPTLRRRGLFRFPSVTWETLVAPAKNRRCCPTAAYRPSWRRSSPTGQTRSGQGNISTRGARCLGERRRWSDDSQKGGQWCEVRFSYSQSTVTGTGEWEESPHDRQTSRASDADRTSHLAYKHFNARPSIDERNVGEVRRLRPPCPSRCSTDRSGSTLPSTPSR